MKVAKLNNRILFLSPTVQAGWQAESFKTDFENVRSLGKGAFGSVWQGKHKKSGKTYAIKEIKKKSVNSPKLLQHVKTQVRIMYLLNHPNIIKLYNHFQDEFSMYFVLEFADQGELYKKMLNEPNNRFSEEISSQYIDQIVEALRYIHKHNVIHRDIKPENILVDKEGNLKLADFGWSNFVDEPHSKRQTYCGTLDYLAPEMIEGSHSHDYRVDIWSVGVLIYEMVCGFSPFSFELLQTNNMSEKKVKENISKVRFAIPEDISSECKDLISKLLIREPEKRISLQEVQQHPWIVKYRKFSAKSRDECQKIWYSTLKNEFNTLVNSQSDSKNQTFTEDEIYKCSRADGILNKKINQGLQRENLKDRRIKELELKVKELQLQNKIKDEELREKNDKNDKPSMKIPGMTLIKSSEDHEECHKKVEMLMNKIKEQDEQIKKMHMKMMDSQRKLRELTYSK